MKKLLLFFILIPGFVHADLVINEISYNPEGTDAGFEWIEIYNNGDSVSVENYLLREQEVNHKLTSVSDAGYVIPSGGYAIIADNTIKFLEAFPGYPGVLLDSVFSLVNTGELLELLDPGKALVFGVQYNPDKGGNGDGSTLGLISNEWSGTKPTPGYTNISYQTAPPEPEEESEDPEDETTVETPQTDPAENTGDVVVADSDIDTKVTQVIIKADAGKDRILLAGVTYTFKGLARNEKGAELTSPKFTWNFGDGLTDSGKSVRHTFESPGNYVGTLTAYSGRTESQDTFEIRVLEPKLVISSDTAAQKVFIDNQTNYSIDISGFIINTVQDEFVFPEGSVIKKKTKIALSGALLKLDLDSGQDIIFLSPNRVALSSYNQLVNDLEQDKLLVETEKLTVETVQPETSQVVYIKVAEPLYEEVSTSSPVATEETFTKLELPKVIQNSQSASVSPFAEYWVEIIGILIVLVAGLGLTIRHYWTRLPKKPE